MALTLPGGPAQVPDLLLGRLAEQVPGAAAGVSNEAAFGAISEQIPGRFSGAVTYPNGVAGTRLGSDAEVSGESHLAPFPAGNLVPLRVGDLRSLIAALEAALAAGSIDPLWQQILTFAQQAAA